MRNWPGEYFELNEKPIGKHSHSQAQTLENQAAKSTANTAKPQVDPPKAESATKPQPPTTQPKPDHFHKDPITGQKIAHEDYHGKYESRRPQIWKARILVRMTRLYRNSSMPNRSESHHPMDREGQRMRLPNARPGTTAFQKMIPHLAPHKGEGQEMSAFEKIFYHHNKEGEGGGKEKPWTGEGSLKKGQFCFRAKGEKEATAMEQKFLPFRFAKSAKGGEVESLIYRMILKNPPQMDGKKGDKGNMPALIGDLRLANGKTEKFARIPFSALTSSQLVAKVLAKLSTMLPGNLLSKVMMSKWFGGGQLSYLALSHKVVRTDLAKAFKSALTESAQARSEGGVQYGREARKGMALNARTEQMVAEHLNINIRSVAQKGGEGVGQEGGAAFADPRAIQEGIAEKGGIFSLFKRRRRGSGAPLYIPGWVPWYQLVWQPKKWKGKIKWYIPLLYFIAISTAGLATLYLVKFLLPN